MMTMHPLHSSMAAAIASVVVASENDPSNLVGYRALSLDKRPVIRVRNTGTQNELGDTHTLRPNECRETAPLLRTHSASCGAEREIRLAAWLSSEVVGYSLLNSRPNEKRLSDAAPKLVKRGAAGGGG